MKRRLIVMRHAKSSWSDGALTDHQRPLNKRGRRDAPRIAAALESRGWAPEVVLSSDSNRTRQTWERMANQFLPEVKVTWLPAFYHGRPGDVLEEVSALPDEIKKALVLGHNPGWETTVRVLSGRDERMTTANAALLEAEGCWQDLAAPDAWELVTVIRPKELED